MKWFGWTIVAVEAVAIVALTLYAFSRMMEESFPADALATYGTPAGWRNLWRDAWQYPLTTSAVLAGLALHFAGAVWIVYRKATRRTQSSAFTLERP